MLPRRNIFILFHFWLLVAITFTAIAYVVHTLPGILVVIIAGALFLAATTRLLRKREAPGASKLLTDSYLYRVLILTSYLFMIIVVPYVALFMPASNFFRIIFSLTALIIMLTFAAAAAHAATSVPASAHEMRRISTYLINYAIVSYAVSALCWLLFLTGVPTSSNGSPNTPIFSFFMHTIPPALLVNFFMIVLIITRQIALMRNNTSMLHNAAMSSDTINYTRSISQAPTPLSPIRVTFVYVAITIPAVLYGGVVLAAMFLAGISGP